MWKNAQWCWPLLLATVTGPRDDGQHSVSAVEAGPGGESRGEREARGLHPSSAARSARLGLCPAASAVLNAQLINRADGGGARHAEALNPTREAVLTSEARVLVTGATGNVGREVLRALKARQLVALAGIQSPERQRGKFEPDTPVVPLDFREPRTFEPAVRGCHGLFLLRPPAISDVEPTLNRLVDVAIQQGVRHIVFLSVAGAEKNRFIPHHAVEAHLKRAQVGWTLLRPGFFAQNLGDAYREDIREDDRLYVPAGHGRAAFIDVRDAAEVAAAVFLAPESHRSQAYTLTGPAAVSFEEAASLLTRALGRPIRYQAASVPGYAWHLRGRRRLPMAQVAVQTVLHVGLRFGQAERVDETLERLLGRPGRMLETYIADHAALWRR